MASIYEITSDIAFINQMLEANGEVVTATTYAYVYTFIVSK